MDETLHRVGIIGITGAVGKEVLKLIETMPFNIKLEGFASINSIGNKFKFKNRIQKIKRLTRDVFQDLDYAIFCSSSDVSKGWIPIGICRDCICIDNSSAFRMDKKFPLVVPQVNPHEIFNSSIICNPNCCTILMTTTLAEVHRNLGISEINVSTYQAASGAGIKGLRELKNQMTTFPIKCIPYNVFGREYVNNCFSHNSKINPETGYNGEEEKMIEETKKIFDDDNIIVIPTCVRVPVLRSHCESITFTTRKNSSLKDIYKYIDRVWGVDIVDSPEPVNTSGKNNIQVGRIRKVIGKDNTYSLFLSGDQLLKGAALNACEILLLLLSENE